MRIDINKASIWVIRERHIEDCISLALDCISGFDKGTAHNIKAFFQAFNLYVSDKLIIISFDYHMTDLKFFGYRYGSMSLIGVPVNKVIIYARKNHIFMMVTSISSN